MIMASPKYISATAEATKASPKANTNVPPHPVAPGNASDLVGTATINAFATQSKPEIQIKVSTPFITPNGDGVNDRVLIQYQIRVLGVGVPHELTVYDLAGRRVRQLISAPGSAGVYERAWDGMDESGQRVLPGTYIYEVKLETDRGTQLGTGALAVAY